MVLMALSQYSYRGDIYSRTKGILIVRLEIVLVLRQHYYLTFKTYVET